MALTYKEYPMPHNLFKVVGQMSDYEIQQMMKKYPNCRQSDGGIPVFAMIAALNEERKKFLELSGGDENKTPEQNKLELDRKREDIMSKRITNQTKLSILIPKAEATKRVKDLFRSVQNIVKTAVKQAAPQLIGAKDQRDIEQVLTKAWNGAVDVWKEGAKIIPWEVDGSAELLMTRLVNMEEEDPEFAAYLKAREESRAQT